MYTFSPDFYELVERFYDALADCQVIGDDDREMLENPLEDIKDELDDSEVSLTISMEDGFLSEIVLTMEKNESVFQMQMSVSTEDGYLSEVLFTMKDVDETYELMRCTISDYNAVKLPETVKSYEKALEEYRSGNM